MLKFFLVCPILLLTSCATLVNGSSQTITVSTTPQGATCTLDRVGVRVAVIGPTPGTIRLNKSKNELTVTCTKDGYETATVTHSPSFSFVTLGNVIAGGLVGVVVDASTGANYEYAEDVELTMVGQGPTRYPPLPARTRHLGLYALPDSGSLPSEPRLYPLNADDPGS